MAYHFIDNVYSKCLTPREPSIELLDAACERNIIVCLSNASGKTFIASKLTQYIATKAKPNEGTLTLYVSDSPSIISKQAACFQRLMDVVVMECHNMDQFKKMEKDWKVKRRDQILFVESHVAVLLLKKNLLIMSDVNLMILHGCQCVIKSSSVPMKEIMTYYDESTKCRILGLVNPLFLCDLDLSKIESMLNKMEDILNCEVETASNVLSVLRYGTQPHEVILEYGQHQPSAIDQIIENEILNALNFIRDHRFDPSEMYEGFTEELLNIPDPKCDPEEVLLNFLNVLHTLGPWSADRAALVLLLQIEKLKVTTPYERHFLLLCMTSTVLVKIRAIFEDFFKDFDEKERIYKFSSPKLLRVIEILRKFIPEKSDSNAEELSGDEDNEKDKSTVNGTKSEKFITIKDEKLLRWMEELSTKKNLESDDDVKNEFLLKRLKHSELKNLMYKQFVKLIKIKNLETKQNLHLGDDNNCDVTIKESDKVTDLDKIYPVNESDEKNCSINDNFSQINININDNSFLSGENSNSNSIKDEEKTLNAQYKNGYLQVPDDRREIVEIINDSSPSKGSKINEVKTLENYLQCHEYLWLPKFKVDRISRYDKFNSTGQFGRVMGQDEFVFRQQKNYMNTDVTLCGLIFVEKKFTAKVLFHVLNDLKQADEDFSFLSVQFTVGKVIDGTQDPKGAENEHKTQELMLKKFRMRICNLLIGTSFLEEGIDLPKCNLVIRFDVPKNYNSYINTKERARATDSLYCFLVDSTITDSFINELGKYYETEVLLLKKCKHLEPPEEEEKEADQYTQLIQPFCPLMKQNCPYVDLSTAISLINRYCAKLPSDTFTKLTPTWHIKMVNLFGQKMFICSIRLPVNSPLKQEVEGCPMPTRVLARRFAAFQCCQILHRFGELDDTLQPISKESFWMHEEEQLAPSNEELEEMIPKDSTEPRPGTTKRRQYYYKKIADSLTDCLPEAGKPSFLYNISMELTCPLPEEQNTRGRKIHPPEDSSQGFGILTRKSIPKIGPFPIFTRSGEVQVKLQLAQSTVTLSELQIEKIVAFIHYTFTSVLRLQKYLMMFDPNASENSYFIVPIRKEKNQETIQVDWDFLEIIFKKRNQTPVFISEEERKSFVFDPSKFEDAVVSPWYRNQDQPQYLYVAEICNNLNPRSSFPGNEYETFEEYFFKKYGIQIQNSEQALLDVDHTSARLNFLTPRYVNRKGVALPTTSEEKKRAKRENLKQKQILVPELCDIHPFPATLWRKAVCLPCILHRINALLLADQVRRIVASEIRVGSTDLPEDFNWKPLNFGWSLADVLKQTKALQKVQQQTEAEEAVKEENKSKSVLENLREIDFSFKDKENEIDNTIEERQEEEKIENWIEIGTWSNDMANKKSQSNESIDDFNDIDDEIILPKNVTMIADVDINGINGWDSVSSNPKEGVRYCSPTSWMGEPKLDEESFTDYSSDRSFSIMDYYSDSSSDTDSDCGGIKIKFKEDNVAEAIENNQTSTTTLKDLNEVEEEEAWSYEESENYLKYEHKFNDNLEKRKKEIISSKNFFDKDKPFDFIRSNKNVKENNISLTFNYQNDFENLSTFGNFNNSFPQIVTEIPDDVLNLPHTDIILRILKEEEKKKTNQWEYDIINNDNNTCNMSVDNDSDNDNDKNFSFDEQPDLKGHPGPSPSLILQALTMSNANDGINLERLETIGDSFLKYAITTYLYCVYENVHEGKLSHLRSKQVSNFNLYRLGRIKALGESMIATKFEPHDNWLPPCYYVPREFERALIEAGVPASHWNRADLPSLRNLTKKQICQLVREKGEQLGIVNTEKGLPNATVPCLNVENMPCFIPYNLMTQHSIPDKSIADCVEALIGAYLVACGPRGALLFMSWLGIKVLPKEEKFFKTADDPEIKKEVGCSQVIKVKKEEGEVYSQICFGELKSPKQPILHHLADPEGELQHLLRGFDVFEDSLQYHFRDRSYLLQALTHASYSPNKLTDCYQRLEFLGDAVLDYLITRHLYEDPRHHSPGALTDLRSALVNNTIFASLAVRHNFHKYFRHLCPGLNEVVDRFVRIQQENGHSINEEFYLIEEEECEEAEDVEVPKALGDVFESVAGAIFLDSGMSLDAVWKVYYRIMKKEIELFSMNVPKSPIRELFELEPETAQFGKPEKLADGKRVRVIVEIFGKGLFKGIGRNYRIAKCTAAKCALKQLKRKGLLERKK